MRMFLKTIKSLKANASQISVCLGLSEKVGLKHAQLFLNIMRLSTLYKRLQQFKPAMQTKVIEGIIKKERRRVVNFNREQMLSGVKSDGKKIRPPYTSNTIQRKKKLGQPFDHVTLRNKGTFQHKMILDGDSFGYRLTSQDGKKTKLVRKYGREIFGLTRSNKKKLAREVVLPAYTAAIRKKLFRV